MPSRRRRAMNIRVHARNRCRDAGPRANDSFGHGAVVSVGPASILFGPRWATPSLLLPSISGSVGARYPLAGAGPRIAAVGRFEDYAFGAVASALTMGLALDSHAPGTAGGCASAGGRPVIAMAIPALSGANASAHGATGPSNARPGCQLRLTCGRSAPWQQI